MEKIIGTVLFNNQINSKTFYDNCEEWNINTLIAPPSVFTNKTLIDVGKSRKFNIALNFPVFFNQEYLKAHPDCYSITSNGEKAINDWLHFACPSHEGYIDQQLEYLENQLQEIKPSILIIDFIRFYTFWEKIVPQTSTHDIIDGCYCPSCLRKFQDFSNLTIEGNPSEWIRKFALTEWGDWKSQIITNVATRIHSVCRQFSSEMLIGIKVVPWRQKDFNNAQINVVGQNIEKLAKFCDVLIPMTYSQMVGREPEWINSVLKDIKERTNKKVLASIQIDTAYQEAPIDTINLKRFLKHGLAYPSSGIMIFHYGFMENDKAKANLVKKMLKDFQ